MNQVVISKKEAVRKLWELGHLHWKLDPNQLGIYSQLKGMGQKVQVLSASRRMGKSFLLTLMAMEYCLQNKNSVVKYVAPEGKMIKRDIRPIVRTITEDCPKELKPTFNSQDNIFYFPNGSELQLAGSDNGSADSLRGGSSVLCIVDEAGFCSDLDYLVKSILIPTTLTTKGKVILSSTPPREPGHDFEEFKRQAEINKSLITRTVYDNPRITEEDLKEIIASYPMGKEDIQFKREYECVFLISQEDAVVPEFTQELRESIVTEWKRPSFYDVYVGMDIGFKDLTFGLVAYYDFKNGKLIIEDEYVLNGKSMTTDKLAETIRAVEANNFTDPVTNEVRSPYLRVCDNNLILINDLDRMHGIRFSPADKDEANAALNNLRMWLQQKRIIINPKCTNLIAHLANATWNRARTSYIRAEGYGHFDGVDALKYLVRHVKQNKNPYPAGYDFRDVDEENAFWRKGQKPQDKKFTEHIKKVFSGSKLFKGKSKPN
jgi:hypothetical protein